MPKIRSLKIDNDMRRKLEYIGLDLDDIPESIIDEHDIKFRVLKGQDEKQYKQYRFLNVKDIDILLSDTNSYSELKDKYENSAPLYKYLDAYDEENADRYYAFLNMLKNIEIEDIQKIEKEQNLLAKNIPFKVRFNNNYLWPIYYSEITNRYFMLMSTENANCSTFFYLLKKKIEDDRTAKVFVPITYIDYTGKILNKSELKDVENYLWLFTKNYPSIYEVVNKKNEISLQIVGETEIYGKLKTLYKMSFDSSKEASKFYKLLKALFILQTELPHEYDFRTNISQTGSLEIWLDDTKLEYETLLEFVFNQYMKSIKIKQEVQDEIDELQFKLDNYKKEEKLLENEYISKEKQISTFLECKKSFFGRVKYYFKLGNKSNNATKKGKKDRKIKKEEENVEVPLKKERKEIVNPDKKNYTLDELVASYKELDNMENDKKNLVMDINALKLRNKNLKRKIQNATSYINEINEHKKSIFEFWKYSNKDAVAELEEGEEEELNVAKLEKTFSFEDDFTKFGEAVDKNQRARFTDSELDSSFIATTDIIDLMNRTYKKLAEPKEFMEKLKELKNNKDLDEDEDDNEFDVFGKLSSDKTKERTIKNKNHRETPRDKYQILNIRRDTKSIELKKTLVTVIKDIKRALKKNTLEEDIYVYKATSSELDEDELQIFSLDEESEIEDYISNNETKNKIYLYRIKLTKGTNFIGFSNIIYYNNKNMTLPLGMQLSNKILIDLHALELEETNEKRIRKIQFLDNKNDFSKIILKTIDIVEFKSKVKEKKTKNED